MNIRRFRPGDEERLWTLYRDTTHMVNGKDYTPEQCKHWAPAEVDMAKWRERMCARNPFVAEDDGQLLGFAELKPDGDIGFFDCHTAKPYFLRVGFQVVKEQRNVVCGAVAPNFIMRKELTDGQPVEHTH